MSFSRNSTFRWNSSVPILGNMPNETTQTTSGNDLQVRTLLPTLPTSTFRVNSANTSEQAPTQAFTLESHSRNPFFPLDSLQNALSGGKPECEICLADYEEGDNLRHLPCGHAFHAACIDRWLNTAENCPKCRADVVTTYRSLRAQKIASTRRRVASASGDSIDRELSSPAQAANECIYCLDANRASSSPNLTSSVLIGTRGISITDPRPTVFERRLQNIRISSTSRQAHLRGIYSEMEPIQNRASMLRRWHGEHRRHLDMAYRESDSFTDIWGGLERTDSAVRSEGSSQSMLDTDEIPPVNEVSHTRTTNHTASGINNALTARRNAVEAAMRRLRLNNDTT